MDNELYLIIKEYDKILTYVSEKTGTSKSMIKKEITNFIEEHNNSMNSGYSFTNKKRTDGLIYQYIVMYLIGASKSKYGDYIYEGKEVEFKTGFYNTITIKAALKPNTEDVYQFYERFDVLHFITEYQPPFTVFSVKEETLINYIKDNFAKLEKSYSKNETINGWWKLFIKVPTLDLKKLADKIITSK